MNDLLRGVYSDCPFCGGMSQKICLLRDGSTHHPGKFKAYFGCSYCSARVNATGDTEQEAYTNAINQWNRRV